MGQKVGESAEISLAITHLWWSTKYKWKQSMVKQKCVYNNKISLALIVTHADRILVST